MLRWLVQLIVGRAAQGGERKRDQEERSRLGLFGGWVSIGINVFLFLLKGAVGYLTASIALIADAFHTFSDVVTSAVIVGAFRMARKPSDAEHPFGHGRIEAVATVVVSVLLMVTGVEVFKTAVERILHPKAFDASWWVIGMIGFTIVLKELLARFSKVLAHTIDSHALEADSWHHRSDAVSSVLVMLAFISQRFGFVNIDGLVGILVAGMIIYTGWAFIRKGIDDLLGKQPPEELVRRLKQSVREFPEVIDIHDLIVHQYGETMVLSFHIEIPETLSLKRAHAIAEEVEEAINQKFNTHATVHLDPVNIDDPDIQLLRTFIKKILDDHKGRMSFHDLRMEGGKGKKNIFFDLVADPVMQEAEIENFNEELKMAIMNKFSSIRGVVIEVEPKYAL